MEVIIINTNVKSRFISCSFFPVDQFFLNLHIVAEGAGPGKRAGKADKDPVLFWEHLIH